MRPDTRTWDHATFAAYMRGRRGDPTPTNYATLKRSYKAWEVSFGQEGKMTGRTYAVFHTNTSAEHRRDEVRAQLRMGGSVEDTLPVELQWRQMDWATVAPDFAGAIRDHVAAGGEGLVPGDFDDPDPDPDPDTQTGMTLL